MEEQPHNILLIDHDEGVAFRIKKLLETHLPNTHVDIQHELSAHVLAKVGKHDLMLISMQLPNCDGLDTIQILSQENKDIPIIAMSTIGMREEAVKAIKAGAYDYILKNDNCLFELPLIVEKNLTLHRIKQENIQLQTQLERTLDQLTKKNEQLEEMIIKLEAMAATDPLTGLANRRAFARALQRYFASSARDESDLACIMIDLDGFKNLNDTLGHQKGDQLLQQTSHILQDFVRKSDLAGRFGGDEFVLLLPNRNQTVAYQVAQRVKQTFTDKVAIPISEAYPEVHLSMSMGLTTLQLSHATSPQRFIECADKALYRAKESGKDCIMIYQTKRTSLSA